MFRRRRRWFGKDRLRAFPWSMARKAYLRQRGRCGRCKRAILPERGHPDGYEMDHVVPWSKGGKTVHWNLQLLCPRCNKQKGNK